MLVHRLATTSVRSSDVDAREDRVDCTGNVERPSTVLTDESIGTNLTTAARPAYFADARVVGSSCA